MSAYVVTRAHITYLIDAAIRIAALDHSSWAYYHDGIRHTIARRDYPTYALTGQMLWDENIASVIYRYPDCTKDKLPGPINETFVYDKHRHNPYVSFSAVQTLKACDYYEYQSCEHPGWKTSQSKAFVDALRKRAIAHVPGYAEARWDIADKPAAQSPAEDLS